MRLRITAVVPIVTAIVAFALGITLLTAKATNSSNGMNHAWLTVNTTGLGQNVIQVTPNANPGGQSTPIPGLPGLDDPTGLTGALTGVFGGLLGNVTGALGNGINDLQGQIMQNLTKALGIKQSYSLFVTQMCEGDFANPADANSGVKVDRCHEYKDTASGLRRVANSIPSTFSVGTTNISVPTIRVLGDSINQIVDIATAGSAFMEAMLIIGVVGSGIVMLGSMLFMVGILQKGLVVIVYIVFALLANAAFNTLAVAATAIVYGGKSALNSSSDAIGIRFKTSDAFVAMIWVAAVLSLVPLFFWWFVWFVEFRRHAYAKRRRTPSQIGNYRGILREVRDDRRVHDVAAEDVITPKGEPIAREEMMVKTPPPPGSLRMSEDLQEQTHVYGKTPPRGQSPYRKSPHDKSPRTPPGMI